MGVGRGNSHDSFIASQGRRRVRNDTKRIGDNVDAMLRSSDYLDVRSQRMIRV